MRQYAEQEQATGLFNRSWEYISASNKPMGPELFVEAGMPWYADYRHSKLPGVWVHKNAPQFPTHKIERLAVFLAAPSNAGKDALEKYVLEYCPGLICPVITATDRPRRDNERDGIDQIFLTPEKFQEWKATDKFIEASPTRPPNWFGIPKESVQAAMDCGSTLLFRITYDGILKVKPYIEHQQYATSGVGIIPILTFKDYKDKLERSGKEGVDERLNTAKNELYTIGQLPDVFPYILENPWNQSGVPTEAGESFHTLLHKLQGTRH